MLIKLFYTTHINSTMKYLIHTFIFLAITSCTIQKSQLDLNEEFDGNYEVKENDTGVYAIAFDSDENKVSKTFIIYRVDGMEMLYKDVLPKGGDIKWHNSSYIQIVESGVMPGIEESSESKKYYLKVPEMNKVKIVNKE
jgi:hypothetical protein